MDEDLAAWARWNKSKEDEHDNSLLLKDAASQLRAAAYRLKKAMQATGLERKRLLSEAMALLHAAEARIK